MNELTLTNQSAHQMATRANTDDQLIQVWLKGKSGHTARAYMRQVAGLLTFAGVGIRELTIDDIYDYKDELIKQGLSEQSIGRHLAAIKSLLTFAQKVAYTRLNIGPGIKLPRPKDTLSARIMSESDTMAVILAASPGRDRLLMSVLYNAGLRVSEAVSLTWGDVRTVDDTAILTVYGKGSKTRYVRLAPKIAGDLLGFRPESASDSSAVFVSNRGTALTANRIRQIVADCGKRAGNKRAVSPHWFRHAHASHALKRGAPAHVVSHVLGHSSLAVTSRYAHVNPEDSSADYLPV